MLVLGLFFVASRLTAQSAGPWIPIGSHADRALRWALDAGALPRLDPLTRPWRLAAARQALALADTTNTKVRWALDAVAALGDSVALVAEVGVQAYSDGGREPIRHAGADGASAAGGLRAQVGGEHWIAVLNPAFDERWRDDPAYTGYRGGPVTGRLNEAYLALTGSRGDLVLGRMARNWGPASLDGFHLSSIASPGDQLAGAIRFGRFELMSLAQRLDDRDTLATIRYQRWFVGHRLTIRLGEGSWIALNETGVYGGYGAGFDLAMHAPLNLALLSEINEGQSFNAMLGAEAALRLPGRMRLELAGFLDDIQVDDDSLSDQRPTAYGLSAGVVIPLSTLPVHVDLRYARVASLAYRNSFDTQLIYAVRDVGIGRNAADFDESRLRLSWKPAARIDVLAEVMYLRQGSYDFRQPFPNDTVLAQPGQGFLVAPVAHARMARISAIAEARNGLTARADLGIVRTLAGTDEAIAAVELRWRFDLLRRRPGGALSALTMSW